MDQEFFLGMAQRVRDEDELFDGYCESGIGAGALIIKTVERIIGADPEALLIEQGIVEQVP